MSQIINGRERFSYVQAWEMTQWGLRSGRVVKGLEVDCDSPITLKLCQDIFQKAKQIDERDIKAITIKCTEFQHDPDNFNECNLPLLRDDEFHFDAVRNTLLITKMGRVVYVNIDGDKKRGQEAHVAWSEMP